MADDIQEAEQIEQVSEETPVETQVSEEKESVESEPQLPEETPVVEESNLVKSERGQKRVQDLANKAAEAEQEVKDLRDRFYEKSQAGEQSTRDVIAGLSEQAVPYTGDYVTDLRMAEDRGSQKAINQFRKEQVKRDRFMSDVRNVEDDYSELRKGSSNFDKDLTHDVVTFYQEASNNNPDLRLKPFVDKVMKLRTESSNQGKSESVEELIQQEKEGAVTPSATGVKKQTKDPKDMSLDELEAIVQ